MGGFRNCVLMMRKEGVCSCEGGPAEACQECLEGIITNSEQLSNSTDAAILLLQKRDMKRTSAGTCEVTVLVRFVRGK